MFSFESIIIIPAILAYISILIQIDEYIDRQIELLYYLNQMETEVKEALNSVQHS